MSINSIVTIESSTADHNMKIGELAKSTGYPVQTIRYYEKEGLVSSTARSEGNFRLYYHAAIKRMLFIKHCRNMDLSLSDIRQLLALMDSPETHCNEVNQMINKHLEEVELRLVDLHTLRDQLQLLQQSCSKDRTVEECGILKKLSNQ